MLLTQQTVKVVRSAAKVAWHVKYNGQVVDVKPTKREAVDSRDRMLAVLTRT